MNMTTETRDPLLGFGCVILGGMVGGLIAFPVASQTMSASGPILLAASTAAGLLVGYRRRKSRPFLYFCLFVIVTLLTLILFNM